MAGDSKLKTGDFASCSLHLSLQAAVQDSYADVQQSFVGWGTIACQRCRGNA